MTPDPCLHRRWIERSIPCVLLLLLAGCGGPHELAPVSGVVTIDGQPYPGGKVIFYPQSIGDDAEAGRPSIGKPDSQGRYTLSCMNPGDGAIIGDHTVTLFRAANHDEIRPDLKDLRFSRMNLRGGKVTVEAGQNEINVELSSEEIAQHGNRI